MLRQSLQQKQNQRLSPQQIQLMKLLQVPTVELEVRIKQELEAKYKNLLEEYNDLDKKLDEFQNQEEIEQKKQLEFSEKIDELNQETDTLLNEIDKWQT